MTVESREGQQKAGRGGAGEPGGGEVLRGGGGAGEPGGGAASRWPAERATGGPLPPSRAPLRTPSLLARSACVVCWRLLSLPPGWRRTSRRRTRCRTTTRRPPPPTAKATARLHVSTPPASASAAVAAQCPPHLSWRHPQHPPLRRARPPTTQSPSAQRPCGADPAAVSWRTSTVASCGTPCCINREVRDGVGHPTGAAR
ncbi:hypothetical protein SEVIR_9G100201v4 [Setaria viridis]